jgi:hypothetical protein
VWNAVAALDIGGTPDEAFSTSTSMAKRSSIRMMLGGNSPSWPKTYSATGAPREMLDLTGRLMPLLLGGEDPACVLLREQYARATITEITLSGAGFFVDFEVAADVARVTPPNFQGGVVNIRVEGLENGGGCLLFVRDGVLSFLEGYTYGGEEWPEHPNVVELWDARSIAPPGGSPS